MQHYYFLIIHNGRLQPDEGEVALGASPSMCAASVAPTQ